MKTSYKQSDSVECSNCGEVVQATDLTCYGCIHCQVDMKDVPVTASAWELIEGTINTIYV